MTAVGTSKPKDLTYSPYGMHASLQSLQVANGNAKRMDELHIGDHVLVFGPVKGE